MLSFVVLASENGVVDYSRRGNMIAYESLLKQVKCDHVLVELPLFEILKDVLPSEKAILITSGQSEHKTADSIDSALTSLPGDAEIIALGTEYLTDPLWEKADTFHLIKIHRDSKGEKKWHGVRGNWKESGRTLYWGDDEHGFNYSVITYVQKEHQLPALSVVLSTCNQAAWLEKVLWGYEAQTVKDFELIIADDGSGKETYDMLQQMAPQLSYPVKHVWHEDKGFRKCDILNKGILACRADYALFSDGDCIPRNDFIATHLKLRRKGRFLSGGYHKLSMELSQLISKEEILSGNCFNVKWLKERGMPNSFKNNKFTSCGLKKWLLNTFTPTGATWNGHNASGWMTDILAVKGFDERMQYGGQDREFGERMENNGIRGKQIRYSTVCIHLDHSRGYKTEESIRKNRDIRKNTRKNKIKYTEYGL